MMSKNSQRSEGTSVNGSISQSDDDVNTKHLPASESAGNIEYIGQIDTCMNSSGMKSSKLTELMTSNMHDIISGNIHSDKKVANCTL